MSDVNVLVVFYSRDGETEKMATAAGVGAIQARANLRLRRLKDLADAATIQRDAAWTAALERMSMDYIAPREIDMQWADVILVASPPDSRTEMTQYLKSIQATCSKPIVAIEELASAVERGKQAAVQARASKT